MQKDFIDGSLGTPEAQNIVKHVAKKIIEFSGTIIFTRDTHQENYLDTQEGKNLPVAHCIKGTGGWNIHPLLTPSQGVAVVDKNTFGSKELPQLIKEQWGEEPDLNITLVGLCTDICVISNAIVLKAFFPEATITVDEQCCAGVTPQSHTNAINAMKMCQIKIVNESH